MADDLASAILQSQLAPQAGPPSGPPQMAPNQVVAQNTPGSSAFAPSNSNFAQATADLNLTPAEQALYQRHLSNMFGPGGVDHANGSR